MRIAIPHGATAIIVDGDITAISFEQQAPEASSIEQLLAYQKAERQRHWEKAVGAGLDDLRQRLERAEIQMTEIAARSTTPAADRALGLEPAHIPCQPSNHTAEKALIYGELDYDQPRGADNVFRRLGDCELRQSQVRELLKEMEAEGTVKFMRNPGTLGYIKQRQARA